MKKNCDIKNIYNTERWAIPLDRQREGKVQKKIGEKGPDTK